MRVVSDIAHRLKHSFNVPGHPDRESAFSLARFNRLRHGELIVSPQSPAPEVHYVESGRIKMVLHGPRGNDRVVSILGAGLFAGETHIHMHSRCTAVYALGMVETYSWDIDTATWLVQHNPAFAMHVIASLAFKARLFAAQIEALSFFSASERVARTIRNLAEIYGEPTRQGIKIRLRVTQEDIGEMANTSRVTVSKVVSGLRRQGLLIKHNGWYTVTNLDQLVTAVTSKNHIA